MRSLFSPSFALLLLSFLVGCPAEARYLNKRAPFHISYYRLIDLGETFVSRELLKKHSYPISLAPRINSQSVVIGNRGIEAFVWSKEQGFRTFGRKECPTFFVDINDRNVVLGKIAFKNGGSEWFLWPEAFSIRERFAPKIDCAPLEAKRVHFRALNDKGEVLGLYRDSSDSPHTIFWDGKGEMKLLPCDRLYDINNRSYMVGAESGVKGCPPFLFHPKAGMGVIGDDELSGKPKNAYYYSNPVIAKDNTVYGNFTALCSRGISTLSYMWNCDDAIFTAFNLYGMTISSANSSHQLVGSLANSAVISINHGKPIDLFSLVIEGGFCWCLIDATDINDKGEIVGYGIYLGNIHLFLLVPMRGKPLFY